MANKTKTRKQDWDIDIAARALEEDASAATNKKSQKKSIWKSVGFVLVAVQAVTSVLLIVSLVSMNIIGGPLVVLVSVALGALLIFSAVKLLIQKKATAFIKTLCSAISIICILMSIFTFRYTDAFNNFLSKVTERKPETKSYSVVVLNDSEIKGIEGIKEKAVGFLKTDPMAGNAEQHLQTKVEFEADFYDDIDTLTRVFTGKIVDAVTLETDRINMLKEEAADSVKDIRIIYKFEIELSSERTEISEKEVTKEPFVLYISGTDSRAGVHATARSDVNIVAVVNPVKGKILLVSIPRDMYVQLHGTTGIRDKLTHAGVYGTEMSRTTIEDFLGIKIDYTAKVSFDTVVSVVDEIGGITINSDTEMTLGVEGKSKKCSYKVGEQEVDGDCALRFARERKTYVTGDRHRGENQMQVISAIVAKLSASRDLVLKLPEILKIAADSFETSLSRADISAFIRMQLNDGTNWEVESISVDGAGSMQGTYSMGASRPLYVMIPYPESVKTAQEKISEYLQ